MSAIIKKISPANRSKVVAMSHPNVWIKWENNMYLGYVEVKNNNGERYQISMSQLQWDDLKSRMDKEFEKNAHA